MAREIEQSIHQLIVNEEDARACQGIDESACREAPGSFLRILLAQWLSKIGDALLNPKVMLPWLLQVIGAPLYLISLLVPIRESGSMIPQIVVASYIRRLPRRKFVWVAGALAQGVCVAIMAGAVLLTDGALGGYIIVGALILFSLARGFCSVANKDVLGKTIPKRQRGQLNGWSASAAGLVTLAVAALLYWLGDFDSLTIGIGLLLSATAAWFVAGAIFALIDEYEGATDGGRNGLQVALDNLKLLRQDPTLRRFIIARALLLCSALSAPFLVVLAQGDQGSSPTMLALFMAASGLSSFLSGPIWGRFADLSSRRTMILGGLLAIITTSAVVLVSLIGGLVWLLPVLYVVLTIAHQGIRVGRKTYIVNMADGNRRTDYVAVSNTIIGLVLLVLGLLGALASTLGTQWVLVMLTVIGGAGVLVAWRLPER